MNTDAKFIRLIEDCKRKVHEHPTDEEDQKRFDYIVEELTQIKDAAINKTLATDFEYLELTQMIERYDPEEIIDQVLAVNKFYVEHYQDL
ncbi:hypothetical protein [Cytobacillus sp. IB215316]|uniref:hypothetical protein n=1 Tax=Cytobacillus sp. IB215316 TaxID=3097354 RepID=UPI002A17B610|nr:hypothetical protein [Cytobacillus sp. IB215316]MDX8360169.1 hypothetical protein [Cytobacillus sp. IB215316]